MGAAAMVRLGDDGSAQSHAEQHVPELVSGPGVVGSDSGGSRARRRATEDNLEVTLEYIGQDRQVASPRYVAVGACP